MDIDFLQERAAEVRGVAIQNQTLSNVWSLNMGMNLGILGMKLQCFLPIFVRKYLLYLKLNSFCIDFDHQHF